MRFSPFFTKALEILPESLNVAMPLKRGHRSDLPDAVRELSNLLTTERAEMARPYWSSPRFVSAYLRYFLPWNLLRIGRLLESLTLPDPSLVAEPLAVDLGSGPLSFPIALWLSSPQWRRTPLRFVCADTAPRPLELGRVVLEDLAQRLGEPLVWDIRLERAPLLQALRGLSTQPLLITAGNVLNEWQVQTPRMPDATFAERLGEVASVLSRSIHPQGQVLIVEPGTRLGGTLTATLRSAALEENLFPIAPCTHTMPCPLEGRRDRGWCHVHYEDDPGAPGWLATLAKDASLSKYGLSLSYVQLSPTRTTQTSNFPARIISQALAVPGHGLARYGCTEQGLVLIARSRGLEPGALVNVAATDERDSKSGALHVTHANPDPSFRPAAWQDDSRRDNSRRDDSRRDDSRREPPRREDARREPPRREDARREPSRREEPRREPSGRPPRMGNTGRPGGQGNRRGQGSRGHR